MAPLVPAARQLPGLAASAARVVDVIRRPDPVAAPAEPRPIPEGPLGLRVSRLRIRYPGESTDALEVPGLDLPAGTRVIVAGPSASGKSTLAAACLRFVELTAGSLMLVGAGEAVSLQAVDGDDVRRAIGLCEQDPYVFDATIADNLRVARPGATDDELEQALAAARLLDWVRSLPDGLVTLVGEHGARLSAGQRQRLALARALLADVRILILDEPTEHLDDSTARALVADLEAATAGRTLLVLTHRPELFTAAGWTRGPDLQPVARA
jgi:ATP-binding cassette subfamily C protein CydCD